MNEQIATAVGGNNRRSLSFHTQKSSGEPRRYFVTVIDALAGSGMQVELGRADVAHLAEVLAAAAGLFDHPAD
jgi:hypothetical protein